MIKKILKIVATLAVLLLILLNQRVFAKNIEKSEISKKYEEWLELPEEERKEAIAPLPFNVTTKSDETPINWLRTLLKATVIPSRYDLREHINVEVKNQKNTNGCWAFSANSSVETYLMKKGEEYNFSERHLEYDTVSDFLDGINPNGLNRTPGSGGYTSTAFTYYSRGSGPILEEDMPFENNENKISLTELPVNAAIKKVDDMVYLPSLYKYKDNDGNIIYKDANNQIYTEAQAREIRNQIKEHIMNYGGVTTNVLAADDKISSYIEKKENNTNLLPNHAVTIIGWDDEYSKENFDYYGGKPINDGAYIILNSWGKEWGENGVYYISYDDAFVESQARGVTSVSNIEYDNIYQYDISEIFGYYSAKYSGNVFTCNEDESLTEVMIGSTAEQKCNVYVNASNDNLDISKLKQVANNVTIKPGYTTIKIEDSINLIKGNKFAVVVELLGEYTGIGAECNTGTAGNAISSSGESFISYDGEDWEDIYNERDMSNLSIKAFTRVEEKNIEILKEYLNKPTKVDKTYIYNGANQTYELNGFDTNKMTISGNIRKNAGTQTVTVSLTDSSKYVWSDGTTSNLTYTFNIEKADIKYTSSNGYVVHDGQAHGIILENIIPSNATVKFANSNDEYVLSQMPKYKGVGSYTIKYRIFIDDNYKDVYGSNEVKIYGIKSMDSTLELRNNIVVIKDYDNSFTNICNRINIYANEKNFYHYDSNKEATNEKVTKTGDYIKINISNLKEYEYAISVLGDVNGDGKISALDYVKIKNNIMKTTLINSEVSLISADVNDDGKISALDYVRIKNCIMNGGN